MGQAHMFNLNKKKPRCISVWKVKTEFGFFFHQEQGSIKLGEQYFNEIYFFKTHVVGQL